MKNINLYNIFRLAALLLVFVGFNGCSEDEEPELLFDKTPTERQNVKVDELRTLLKSSENGWKFVYFPNEEQVGGFTFVFKFTDDQNVQMTSDFDDDTSLVTSKYDVLVGSTVKLSFSTKNDLHKLADGGNPPDPALIGRGYFGDFEFLYYGQDGQDLIFRANRTSAAAQNFDRELRFTRASATDIQDINFNRDVFNNIRFNSVYSVLEIEENGVVSSFVSTFDFNRRILTAVDADGGTAGFSFGCTKKGLVSSQPIEVGNQSFTNFVYDSIKNEFVSEGLTGNNSSTIKFLNAPIVLGDDNELVTSADNAYGYIDDFLSGASSPAFVSLRDAVNENVSQIGFKISRVQFSFTGATAPGEGVIIYRLEDLADGSFADAVHTVNYVTSEEGIIKLMPTGSWNIPETFIPLFSPIDDVLTNAAGLYVKEEDYTVRFTNTIVSFTGVASPNVQMVTYAFQ